MKKILQVANGVALVSTIIINYLSNTGKLNNTTIGEVSDDLNSLVYTCGICLLYLGLYLFTLIGLYCVSREKLIC